MLKIGDFARLARLSVKTLRHYHKVGLLRPEQIDYTTGYRYYSLDQLPRLNRILALKELGLSLDQVALWLERDLSREQMLDIVRLKQAEVEQRQQALQVQAVQLQNLLQQIGREAPADSADFSVVHKTIAPLSIAALRALVPPYETDRRTIAGSFARLRQQLDGRGLPSAGPALVIWPDGGDQSTAVDVEVGVPIDADTKLPEPVKVRHLPRQSMACILGPPERLAAAYRAGFSWLQAHGFCLARSIREVHLAGPDGAASAPVEIQFPIEPEGDR